MRFTLSEGLAAGGKHHSDKEPEELELDAMCEQLEGLTAGGLTGTILPVVTFLMTSLGHEPEELELAPVCKQRARLAAGGLTGTITPVLKFLMTTLPGGLTGLIMPVLKFLMTTLRMMLYFSAIGWAK